jgi:hypothetical protein
LWWKRVAASSQGRYYLRFAVAITGPIASYSEVRIGPTNGASDSQHAFELLEASITKPLLQVLTEAAPVLPPAGKYARRESMIPLPEEDSYVIICVRNLYADTVMIRGGEILGFASVDGPFHQHQDRHMTWPDALLSYSP